MGFVISIFVQAVAEKSDSVRNSMPPAVRAAGDKLARSEYRSVEGSLSVELKRKRQQTFPTRMPRLTLGVRWRIVSLRKDAMHRVNTELSLDLKIDSVFWVSNEDIGIVFY